MTKKLRFDEQLRSNPNSTQGPVTVPVAVLVKNKFSNVKKEAFGSKAKVVRENKRKIKKKIEERPRKGEIKNRTESSINLEKKICCILAMKSPNRLESSQKDCGCFTRC